MMCKHAPIYIIGVAQISAQPPLCDSWIQQASPLPSAYVRADDPNFRTLLSPLESRRMGHLLKRAAVVSAAALQEAGLVTPDAIFTGTGLGCVESTEKFLEVMCRQGEQLLSPAHFMQSTHNTISSLIAIRTHCHGPNVTFSHKTFSFEQALHEALLELALGNSRQVLVGGYDEVTPSYFTLLRRSGYVGHSGQVACTETSMAAALSKDSSHALACLRGFKTGHIDNPSILPELLHRFLNDLHVNPANLDAVLAGMNGCAENDGRYHALLSASLPDVPQLAYKRLFGENFTVSALGFYAAVRLLQDSAWPAATECFSEPMPLRPPRLLLLLNLSPAGNYAFSLLTTIEEKNV